MWNDSQESQLVRELLRVGREAGSEGYDVKAGLHAHLAHIKAGTPPPSWASHPLSSTVGTVGTGASLPLWGVVAVSVLGAAAGAVLWSDAFSATVPTAVPQVVSPQVDVAAGPPQAVAESDSSLRSTSIIAEHVDQGVTETDEVGPRATTHRRAPHTHEAGPLATQRRVEGAATEGQAAGSRNHGAAAPSGFVAVPATRISPADSAAAAASTHRTLDEVVTSAVRATAASTSVTEQQRTDDAVAQPQPAGTREELLEREMRMLKVAQAVLDSDPARSLRLAEMGESEFRGSMFTQERRYVLIVALARLGRTAEAHRLAAAYLSTYPNGPFSERIRKALTAP